jgi:hypothetical protein
MNPPSAATHGMKLRTGSAAGGLVHDVGLAALARIGHLALLASVLPVARQGQGSRSALATVLSLRMSRCGSFGVGWKSWAR